MSQALLVSSAGLCAAHSPSPHTTSPSQGSSSSSWAAGVHQRHRGCWVQGSTGQPGRFSVFSLVEGTLPLGEPKTMCPKAARQMTAWGGGWLRLSLEGAVGQEGGAEVGVRWHWVGGSVLWALPRVWSCPGWMDTPTPNRALPVPSPGTARFCAGCELQSPSLPTWLPTCTSPAPGSTCSTPCAVLTCCSGAEQEQQ